MRNRKFLLDTNDLQFKQIELSRWQKVMRVLGWFSLTVVISIFYGVLFEHFFGSPKETRLNQMVEELKFQYSVVNRELNGAMLAIEDLRGSDEKRYRPILQMEELSESYRNPGIGGVERYRDLNGYSTTYLMKSVRTRVDEMKMMLDVQQQSFDEIVTMESEWERMVDHIPSICPVQVTIRTGDGLMLRQVHPVLGVTTYHNGLDFRAPIGTEVFAPGDGQVILAGYNGGFGKCVVIDHGYGYKTIFGHLSDIRVAEGQNVTRGEMLALSGNTGTSTGPHLHYEIRQYDRVKDPFNYFYNNIDEDQYEAMIMALSNAD